MDETRPVCSLADRARVLLYGNILSALLMHAERAPLHVRGSNRNGAFMTMTKDEIAERILTNTVTSEERHLHPLLQTIFTSRLWVLTIIIGFYLFNEVNVFFRFKKNAGIFNAFGACIG